MDDIKCNDGKGLYNNEGACDQAILLCNDAVKNLASGQYIGFCDKICQVVKILANVKDGIRSDRESLEQQLEDLKTSYESKIEELKRMKDGVA